MPYEGEERVAMGYTPTGRIRYVTYVWSPCDRCGETVLTARASQPCRMTSKCKGSHKKPRNTA